MTEVKPEHREESAHCQISSFSREMPNISPHGVHPSSSLRYISASYNPPFLMGHIDAPYWVWKLCY